MLKEAACKIRVAVISKVSRDVFSSKQPSIRNSPLPQRGRRRGDILGVQFASG